MPAANAAAIENMVAIQGAWVRSTNPGQEVGAAYMTLLSAQNATLVGITSDVSESVEIHDMTMQNGVMKMRMLKELPLIAGKPYLLAPGGFHLMLFGLKKPLIESGKVNFILTFATKNQQHFKKNIQVLVQSTADKSVGTAVKSH